PSGTSQAMVQARWLASKLEIVPAPDSPATNRDQVSSTPQASGVTRPIPVITTRRIGPPTWLKLRHIYPEPFGGDKQQSPRHQRQGGRPPTGGPRKRKGRRRGLPAPPSTFRRSVGVRPRRSPR